ncbi:MAG: hypothetical protein L6Q40_09225, partial [Azonexus sp.]|nr:hypothetical protein [Azonexus sp.]
GANTTFSGFESLLGAGTETLNINGLAVDLNMGAGGARTANAVSIGGFETIAGSGGATLAASNLSAATISSTTSTLTGAGGTQSVSGFAMNLSAAGGASDTLNFSTAATITLNAAGTGTATGPAAVTFSGFDTLAGNAATGDSLTVNSVQSASLSSVSVGNVTIGGFATQFSGMESLVLNSANVATEILTVSGLNLTMASATQGTSGALTFNNFDSLVGAGIESFNAGSLSVALDMAGGGARTVNGSMTISGFETVTGSGTLSASNLSAASLTSGNSTVTGAAGSQTFSSFANRNLTGLGSGSQTLTVNNLAISLAAGSYTLGGNTTFSGFESLVGAGTEALSVNNLAVSLDMGAGGTRTADGVSISGFETLSGSAGATLSSSNLSSATVSAGNSTLTGAQTQLVNGFAMTLAGVSSNSTLNASAVNVVLDGAGNTVGTHQFSGFDTLLGSGGATLLANGLTAVSASASSLVVTLSGVSYDLGGFAGYTLNGSGASDSFTINNLSVNFSGSYAGTIGAAIGFTSFEHFIGAGTGDLLSYAGLGSSQHAVFDANSLSDGQMTGGVSFSGIESITGSTGGADHLDFSAWNTALNVDLSSGRFSGFEQITGGSGNDQLHGLAGADTLAGGGGDDTIYGSAGNDNLSGGAEGGAGDTLDYSGIGASTYNLLTSLTSGAAGTDTFSGFEHLVAGSGNDTFIGDAATTGPTINGGAGTDEVQLAVTGGATYDMQTLASFAANIEKVILSNSSSGETIAISKTDINDLLVGSASSSLNLVIDTGDSLTISDGHYWSTDGTNWYQGAVTGLTDNLELHINNDTQPSGEALLHVNLI